MALGFEYFMAERSVSPTDRREFDALKARMLVKDCAYRLRELRERAGMTQAKLAGAPVAE